MEQKSIVEAVNTSIQNQFTEEEQAYLNKYAQELFKISLENETGKESNHVAHTKISSFNINKFTEKEQAYVQQKASILSFEQFTQISDLKHSFLKKLYLGGKAFLFAENVEEQLNSWIMEYPFINSINYVQIKEIQSYINKEIAKKSIIKKVNTKLFQKIKDKIKYQGINVQNYLIDTYKDNLIFNDLTNNIYVYDEIQNLYVEVSKDDFFNPIFLHFKNNKISIQERQIQNDFNIFLSLIRAKNSKVNNGYNKNMYHLKNGILNIENNSINSYEALSTELKKEYFFTNGFDFNYVTESEYTAPKKWLRHLETSLQLETEKGTQDQIKTLKTFIGSIFMQNANTRKALLMLGNKGNNGKSMIIDILISLIPSDLFSSEALRDLSPSLNNSYQFNLAALENKILNIDDDLTTQRIDITPLKQIISQGTISLQRKYKDPRNTIIKAKLLLASNQIPKFKGGGTDISNRIVTLMFNNTFDNNPNYLQGLKNELPNIFTWILKECIPLFNEIGIFENETTQKNKQDLRTQGSNIYDFFNTYIYTAEGKKTGRKVLYDKYKEYAIANNEVTLNSREFYTQMQGYVSEKKGVYISKQTRLNGIIEAGYFENVGYFESEEEHEDYINPIKDDVIFQ